MNETLPSRAAHNLLLSVHIASAVGAFGADLGLLALGIAGLTGTPARALYPAASIVAGYVLQPLALLTLLSGVTLALMSRYGLRHWWVLAKLAIVLLLTAAVLFILVPSLGEMPLSASDTAASAPPFGQRLILTLAPAAATALLLTAVLLGVFKPGRRIGTSAKSA